MKHLAAIVLLSIMTTLQAQTPHDWENPHVLGINKLPQYTIDGNQPHHYAFILEWQ